MELILEVNVESTQKGFGLDKLPLASNYSKDAILNQRKRINEIIRDNMDESYPAIELPFVLFSEIKQEMENGGWCHSEGSRWYYPIWLDKPDAEVQTPDEENKIISAATFYQSTMKQQLIELHAKIQDARDDGLVDIKLEFALYKVIEDKLTQQGWNVYGFKNFSSSTKPYTMITAK